MGKIKNCLSILRKIVFLIVILFFVFGYVWEGKAENKTENKIYTTLDQLNEAIDYQWEDAFAFVRDQIEFEPFTGIMKSSQGVLWGRAGNAVEQARLLNEILGLEGEKVRYAQGKLNEEKAAWLIKNTFPEEKDFYYPKNVLLSAPSQDKEILSAIEDHYWVQILQDNQWIDLDPSFPNAKIGEAYADLDKTFYRIKKNILTKFSISLKVEKTIFAEDEGDDSEIQTILEWQGTLEEVANLPISLTLMANFKSTSQRDEEQDSGGTLFNVFGGVTSETEEEEEEGIELTYRAELFLEEVIEEEGQFSQILAPTEEEKIERSIITKVWLQFVLQKPDEPTMKIERILFEKHQKEDRPSLFQRHSILITGNEIPTEVWEEDLSDILDKERIDVLKSGLEEIKTQIEEKEDLATLLENSISLENSWGPETGHLINLIFASTSDKLTNDLGRALAVDSYYFWPRIIINSFEGSGDELQVYIDLCQDSKLAISYPGQAVRMKETFLYGRGVMESILEGKVIELLTKRKPLTTAYLIYKAAENNIPIRMYSYLEQDRLKNLKMPPYVAKKVMKVLDAQHFVIIPEESIEFNGRQRWGWWDLNPQNREVIGVLDTGLHQAMLERTILELKGPMSTDMALVLGVMVGTVDTYWVIASMILKYGELNKAALQEAKNYMKKISGYLCPDILDEGMGVSIASIDIEDCYSKEFGSGPGVKVDMGWCAKFTKGFKCASTTIMNYYLSEY
ncbi:MAG: hypothetical protein E3J83_01465 [Candidatus Atribacteria bacterium]|nr:MAG: hypothetical protein E3J83_01465 [Candidatus Atribacteria bacterium]